MIRVNYHITVDQSERLKKESKRTGLSVAELIRRFIDMGLSVPKKHRKGGA